MSVVVEVVVSVVVVQVDSPQCGLDNRGRSSRRSRCRYGCPRPHYTHARAEISMCTRDIDTCKLRAGTDKTRANGGEKLWQRDAEERQNRTKKRGAKREKELSSWYCCTVQYLQVPWLPQGFCSQPVGCSHVSPRHPDTHVHSYAPSSSPATRMQRGISTCQPHTHRKQTELRLRQQHSPHHCHCR